jgi:hypothetical protein
MMKQLHKLTLFMAMTGMLFTACQEKTEMEKEIDQLHALKSSHMDNWIFDDASNYFYAIDNAQIDPCGDAKIRPFNEAAQVSIFNDDEYLSIKVTAETDWYIHYLSLNVWNEASDQINSQYSGFPYQKRFSDNMPTVLIYKIP